MGTLMGEVVVHDNISQYDNFSMEYYLDESQIVDIDKLSQETFKPANNKFTFGYIKGNIWFRLKIENQSHYRNLILALSETYFNYVDFYWQEGGEWKIHRSGLSQYFKYNKISDIEPKLNLNMEMNETQILYIRLMFKPDTRDISYGEFQLYTQERYICCGNKSDYLLYLFYFGTLFFIFLFNIFLFFIIRDSIYIYYAGYIFSTVLFVLAYSNLSYHIGLAAYRDELALSLPMITIFFTLFSMQYLNTKKYLPLLDKFLKIALFFLALFSPTILIDFDPWFYITATLITLYSPLFIYAVIHIYRKGVLEVRYYIFALILYIASMVMLDWMSKGIISNSDINHYGFIVISYAEIVFFSFILANRFHKIQNEIIEIKANNEIILEQQVKERTSTITELLTERELLLREIYHRVKNNFQMVISLLWIESNQKKSQAHKDTFLELINRVQSMASVHQYLMGSESVAEIDSQEYLAKVVGELKRVYKAQKSFEIVQDIESHTLSIDQGMALAPIINEVLTNSIKHYAREEGCRIKLSFYKQDERMVLIIHDNGEGFDFDNISQKSFGLKMIKQFIKKLNGARMEYGFEEGTKFKLTYQI
ncbi:MAG: hypothetical protein JXQ76_08860 [Campylobacterales bacterium]|nr:hypothetical protein [Campylobacterales bacterium]